MTKFLKAGKVVVILSGEYAGKKAFIVKVNESGDSKYKFPYAIVCGLERGPRKVLTSMSEKKVMKRTHMKVFTKVLNLQHFMPTRFAPCSFFDSLVTTWISRSLICPRVA